MTPNGGADAMSPGGAVVTRFGAGTTIPPAEPAR